MTLCKKHGKERNIIAKSRRNSRGAVLEFVGCEDCAAGLPARDLGKGAGLPDPAIPPKKKKPQQVEDSRRRRPQPVVDTPATVAKKMEKLDKVRTIGERFGFKF
jgi:hypothetical protein